MNESPIAEAIDGLAVEIARMRIVPNGTSTSVGTDVYGGHVGSLTEAVMGMTEGLYNIAHAIENLGQAIRDKELS